MLSNKQTQFSTITLSFIELIFFNTPYWDGRMDFFDERDIILRLSSFLSLFCGIFLEYVHLSVESGIQFD